MPLRETASAPGVAADFIAHHGQDVFDLVVARMDAFLVDQRLSTLEDVLALAPIFGPLLGRSRRQFRHALQGIAEREPVWMIVTYDPTNGRIGKGKGRRETFDVRAVVGPCGPITVSFEEKFKGTLGGAE